MSAHVGARSDGEIRLLPEDAIARIAAGEVVERPAAALKELIENALDAGARRVGIAIAGGGIDLLEVTDDGAGMAPESLGLALTRHATSKIAQADDLEHLVTYGFRGEALPAIAAAAGRLVLRSARAGEAGAEVVVADGVAGPVLPAAQAPGTTVRVEALFARLPARRAFLHASAAEASACHDVALRAALAMPQVAIRLRSERGEVFASTGSGDRADVLARAQGGAVRAALLPVAHREDGVRVEGYVAEPGFARSTRAGQTFLVRARPVTGRSLVYAAESAYAGRLPRGRFPVFVLAIDLEPEAVDVNVHPQKREVRFRDERRVMGVVHVAVRRALEGMRPPVLAALSAVGPAAGAEARPSVGDVGAHPAAGGEWVTGRLGSPPLAAEARPSWPAPGPATAAPSPPPRVTALPAPALPPAPSGRAEPASDRGDRADVLPVGLTPIRQLRLVFIVAEGADGLYLIDQHAAHERVRYEAIEAAERAGRGPARQRLLPPLVLPLPAALVEVLAERENDVREAGFVATPFGPDAARVTEAPAGVDLPGQLLRDLLGSLGDPTDSAPAEHRRRALLACRSAVRAGDALAPAEMARILADLAACRAPWTCPHGRPTVHRLTWDEMAGFFRRRA